MWHYVCLSLEISILLFFFSFLFSSNCCSVDPSVVCVVSDRYDQSFFALFLYNCCIDESTLSWILPLTFLNIYSLFISSLGYMVLCIAMWLRVLFSICWSSSLVYIRRSRVSDERDSSDISFWSDFCDIVCFLVPLEIPFLKFFFRLHLFDDLRFRVVVRFFSKRSDFSWFCNSIPSVICRFPLFIISKAYFSMPNSTPLSYIYIRSLFVLRFPILFRFWQTLWCHPREFGGWFFSSDLVSLYPPVHFPKYVTQWHHHYYK